MLSQGPLSDGNIYKIKVEKDGVYKLDYNLFNELGIDYSSLDPQKCLFMVLV